MATTAQEVIDAAVQRSALNNPDLVPNAQALKYITNFERKVFIDASRINPDFFGKTGDTAARADNVAGWDVATTPGSVAAISKAEVKAITGSVTGVAVGDEVNLVSVRFPQIEVAPRAYIRDKTIYQIGDELGDSGTNFVTTLTLYYSHLPAGVTTLSQALTLPDEWADLVILPLARVFAIRDRRADEAVVINQEFNFVYESFISHAGVFDHGANRPLVAVPASGPMMGGGVAPQGR